MPTFDSAITRIASIDSVSAASPASAMSQTAAVHATSMPPTLGPTESAGVPPPASVEATDRFKQMMEHATLTVQSDSYQPSGPSAISQVVSSQDASFNELMTSMQNFEKNAPAMDPKAFAAEAVRMQFEVATASMKMEIGVGFAQGGKGAVQSLMKNQ